jgi:hypothetical protein
MALRGSVGIDPLATSLTAGNHDAIPPQRNRNAFVHECAPCVAL